MASISEMLESGAKGDRRAVARLISAVELQNEDSVEVMKQVYPKTGKAHIIGITGSPGAGKSSLVDKLITQFTNAGKSIGIIAIDPSSPFSGGAILGDRLRMQDHALDADVFIRSMGSRGYLGGVSQATYEAAQIMDACGKDIVIIETVGVGQSEVDIIRIADTVCLVLVPGMGDDVQIMKAGIMEIADLFIVNKSDRDGAPKVAKDVQMMLEMMEKKGAWMPPVLLTSTVKDEGIEEAGKAVMDHWKYLNETSAGHDRRAKRMASAVERVIQQRLAGVVERAWTKKREAGVVENLIDRKIDPYTLTEQIMSEIFK